MVTLKCGGKTSNISKKKFLRSLEVDYMESRDVLCFLKFVFLLWTEEETEIFLNLVGENRGYGYTRRKANVQNTRIYEKLQGDLREDMATSHGKEAKGAV